VISVSTLAFALALVALTAAAVASLTCWHLMKAVDLLKSSNETALRNHVANIERVRTAISARLAELDRRSPQKAAAEVVALREAVDSLKATQQRFAGKFYKQLQLDDSPTVPSSSLHVAGLDPELAAELALQAAPPVQPGGR
jgi:hypothetical protein